MAHESQHDPDLEEGYRSLLDAVDQDALHIGHILDETGHDVPGCTIIEPRERQHLDPCVEIAPEVKDHPLLEVIIEQDTETVQKILGEEGCKTRHDQGNQLFRVMLLEDNLDDLLGDRWEDRDHQRPDDRTKHRGYSHPRIAGSVTKDPEQNSHGRLYQRGQPMIAGIGSMIKKDQLSTLGLRLSKNRQFH
jgi:hypothetical protein